MSYILRILNEDEPPLVLVNLHWIYLVKATGYLVFFTGLGWLIDYLIITHAGINPSLGNIFDDLPVVKHIPLSPFSFLSIMAGIWIFIALFIKFYFSEVALTKKRIIYKHGMIHVELEETDLTEIKAEDIDHGIFGYFIGYGYIHIDSRFVDDMRIPAIHQPMEFIKRLQKVRTLKEENLDKELHLS